MLSHHVKDSAVSEIADNGLFIITVLCDIDRHGAVLIEVGYV